jgi:hypothetical protein
MAISQQRFFGATLNEGVEDMVKDTMSMTINVFLTVHVSAGCDLITFVYKGVNRLIGERFKMQEVLTEKEWVKCVKYVEKKMSKVRKDVKKGVKKQKKSHAKQVKKLEKKEKKAKEKEEKKKNKQS